MLENDLIAAISTPIGSSAVGIVRLSGLNALEITGSLFKSYSGKKILEMEGFTSALGNIVSDNKIIDECIVHVYRQPKSYTGEDCVEFSCHGSSYILDEVLRICIKNGARPAEPGEFTRRAFLNGKMNLSQAEAVCDLINSQTEGARKAAISAKNGMLSVEINIIIKKLLSISAHLAAWADYPEEDLFEVDQSKILLDLQEYLTDLDRLISTYERNKMLKEGINTAIIGKPNVGKSTLMNLLVGEIRSIVTNIPGTTRDIIRENVRVGNFILKLMDTAGIRETSNFIEKAGIDLTIETIDSSQLILAVFDNSTPLDSDDFDLFKLIDKKNSIAVVNKIDIDNEISLSEIYSHFDSVVMISSKFGTGKDKLEIEISKMLKLDDNDISSCAVGNQRQLYCLINAKNSLNDAVFAINSNITLDAINICIDSALDQLYSLTGEKCTQKVVNEVFEKFCVGK